MIAIGGAAGISADTGLEGVHEKVSKLKFSVPVHFNAHHRNDPNVAEWEASAKALEAIKNS